MHDHSPSCIDDSFLTLPSPITQLHDALLENKGIQLFVKRDDLIHEHLQGNKWRKLKYNLIRAREANHHTLLTFGGAYSNHIHATAAAGHYFGFKTIGIIRGEAYADLNPTLQDATNWGMQLHYASRIDYRNKTSEDFINLLKEQFGKFYLIPEGGNNALANKGCREIISELNQHYDAICVDCGTGATMAGIISALDNQTTVLGFAVLKDAAFLNSDIEKILQQHSQQSFNNWQLNTDYHFGGYAKVTEELIAFMQQFELRHQITLEPVYSAKMFYGLFELIKNDYFAPGSKILALHSGGLQGRRGYEL